MLEGLLLWQRNQTLQTLQAQLLGQSLLPSASQRQQATDPHLDEAYAELLDVSAQLTMPLQRWLPCLQSPMQAPVQITGFDWSTAAHVVDMRLKVNSRDEFNRYLEALREKPYSCVASLGQEERQPAGAGYQLSLKLRAADPGNDHER
jgi:hypothetical protein